ncbi:single-stranded DNA-binding protein WHY1, chloroplastic isoform X1 [Beta vulgaris subsp. vulgaris]|uniref:single-stranded DNA-binding protein WHY1, chloroplastic isoform X1 n=1 Tax=Beta vulgaris subsp. vulgaris TaxID=3555 RepID=UPI0020369FEE|nr:single-stranded DNA-binding protein WHY1, chloroplastic isoform X1 [Beta vulgaris subsp. vulgaris]
MVQQLLSSPSNFSIKTQLPSHGPTSLPYHSLSSRNSFITSTNHFKLTKNWVSHISSSKLLFSVKCRQSSEYFEQSTPRFSPSYSPNPPTSSPGGMPRVFVGHSIYKGKAALTVEPKAPEFVPLDSGAFKISREGYILLQFAPAAGVRQYDWSRKQVFSLSVSEIGSLVSLGAKDSCEFFHDPNKGKSDEGKVRKVLKVEPLPDGSGYFFNLISMNFECPCLLLKYHFHLSRITDQGVQNKLLNLDENVYIPISKAEFAVLLSAFNFILPYLIGWYAFADSIKPEDSNRANSSNTRTVDHEWSR